jgi:hypothetical protein
MLEERSVASRELRCGAGGPSRGGTPRCRRAHPPVAIRVRPRRGRPGRGRWRTTREGPAAPTIMQDRLGQGDSPPRWVASVGPAVARGATGRGTARAPLSIYDGFLALIKRQKTDFIIYDMNTARFQRDGVKAGPVRLGVSAGCPGGSGSTSSRISEEMGRVPMSVRLRPSRGVTTRHTALSHPNRVGTPRSSPLTTRLTVQLRIIIKILTYN